MWSPSPPKIRQNPWLLLPHTLRKVVASSLKAGRGVSYEGAVRDYLALTGSKEDGRVLVTLMVQAAAWADGMPKVLDDSWLDPNAPRKFRSDLHHQGTCRGCAESRWLDTYSIPHPRRKPLAWKTTASDPMIRTPGWYLKPRTHNRTLSYAIRAVGEWRDRVFSHPLCQHFGVQCYDGLVDRVATVMYLPQDSTDGEKVVARGHVVLNNLLVTIYISFKAWKRRAEFAHLVRPGDILIDVFFLADGTPVMMLIRIEGGVVSYVEEVIKS